MSKTLLLEDVLSKTADESLWINAGPDGQHRVHSLTIETTDTAGVENSAELYRRPEGDSTGSSLEAKPSNGAAASSGNIIALGDLQKVILNIEVLVPPCCQQVVIPQGCVCPPREGIKTVSLKDVLVKFSYVNQEK